ncbi:MAG: ABC transporter ATP-binding protein [Ruminococcaceae bacterium]|nr:ABC transporter ATP-binding protein [Oscillospiraceae bacterium]
MIRLENLTKQYGKLTAVDQLNLEIHEGELFALLGVNGAGKTTTIKLLSCLSSPTSGTALVGGYDVTTDPIEVKRIIAVSPQQTAVAPNLNVRENLELICGVHGYSRKDAKDMTERVLEEFGLQEIAASRAKTLSGGWQRRLSIAMALISNPKVLFLDEPTLGLDVLARRELWNAIRSLKGKVTIVLTTHYLEEAEALCDRIAIMSKGRLRALGTVEQLKAQTETDSLEDAFLALNEKGGEAK